MAPADTPDHELGLARATLWGVTPSVRRGPRPTLTLGAIVDAALGVARSEGLAAVSMAAVAQAAGCAKMALYRHVSDRDDLLTAMVDTALGEPPRPDGGWQERFAALWAGLLDLYDREPWMLDLPSDVDALTPRNAAWIEAGLRVLEGSTLAPGERLGTVMLLTENARVVARQGRDPDRPADDLARLMSSAASQAGALSPDRFPHLSAVGEHGRSSPAVALEPDHVRDMLMRAVAASFPTSAS
ncbi:MAG: TetR/AcrR family transcriptional regulator [Actinomycetaceae bacterium]